MSFAHFSRLATRSLPIIFGLSVGFLTACTQYVSTPDITTAKPLPVADSDLDAVLARITPPRDGTGIEPVNPLRPNDSVDLLRAGDDLGYGVIMTPEAEELWAATLRKDWQSWEEKFETATASLPDRPEAKFFLSSQRLRAMMHAGRIDEARKELVRLEEIERSIFGNVLETTSQYGQLNSWINESRRSIAYNAAVVDAAGDWWLPEFYYSKPENIGDAKRVAGALMRSHIGLTCENIVIHEYRQAMAWGRAGLALTDSVVGISHHPLYGIFVKTTTYMYEGQAWMLTCYAAARIGVSKDIAANQDLIDLAKQYFRQAQYRWGDYLVDSIIDYVLFDTGLKQKRTHRIGLLPEPGLVTSAELASLVRFRPDDLQVREDVELPVPEPDSIKLPGKGAINAYGFAVDAGLAAANSDILAGRYSEAVSRLDEISASEPDALKRWHAAEQAVKTLILAGRSAEAIARIPDLEQRESAYFGTNLGARALRGEAKFWLGDNQGALRDFAQVVAALGDFRPPSLLVFKPDSAQMALLTRAQYLAYLGIARSEMYTGDPEGALPWAEAAEQLFEEAHYTWRHQLYRRYLKLDADMFYARGVNLAVLAGAKLGVDGDKAAAQAVMQSGRAYLQAMGFDAGLMTIDATWAKSLLDAGHASEAEAIAAKAAGFAVENGQTDLLWQVQALRGAALRSLGRHSEAEQALRAAEAAIESVSGALATDASKRQFGLGKEDITRQLIAYDLERRDLAQAFADMERGRARAFVDMLARVRFTGGRSAKQVDQVRALDEEIRAIRVLAAAPGQLAKDAASNIARLTADRRRLIKDLRARDPEMADALSITAQTLGDVQQKLGADDVLLYALPATGADDPIRFLAIKKQQAAVYQTSLSQAALETLLTSFATDNPIADALKQRDAAHAIAAGLGLDAWAPKGALYVTPSRALHFVPWGALPIETPVVVLPNGGWLTRTPPKVAAKTAAVVGDPALGGDWDTLPGARAEAQTISKIYGASPLLGQAATTAGLRRVVGKGVRVLHLATHGVFNARDPLQSAILLSDKGATNRLTATNLFENPLPASLVVLSACETGLGQVSAGNDFLGLARSFYLGGARAVMNSLWPVHDKPTRLFMEVFHKRARNGEIGKAWLAARNTLRAEGFPPSVYGAFVLGGANRI